MIFIRLLSWLTWLMGGNRKASDIPLRFSIELENKDYEFREEINIKCRIENIGERVANLMVLEYINLSVYLQYEDEDAARKYGLCILPRILIRKEDIIYLPSNQAHHFEFLFSSGAYSVPDKIGNYQLYLVYKNWSSKLSGVRLWTGEVKSNKVQIAINKKTKCSLREAIDIANRELVVKQNFIIAQKNIIVDEQNTLWNEKYLSNDQIKQSSQQIIEKLKDKNYWAIFYTPKEAGNTMGGEAWVFVDKNTGEIILSFYLK